MIPTLCSSRGTHARNHQRGTPGPPGGRVPGSKELGTTINGIQHLKGVASPGQVPMPGTLMLLP
eukprot:9626046-Prorocentrum_lima.AAC.1